MSELSFNLRADDPETAASVQKLLDERKALRADLAACREELAVTKRALKKAIITTGNALSECLDMPQLVDVGGEAYESLEAAYLESARGELKGAEEDAGHTD